jgi:hypothetical protein
MEPEQLSEVLHQKPFEPFRMVMTDGKGFEIRHPDLLMVGRRTVIVGLTGDPAHTYFERTVKVDLLHIIRLEPLGAAPSSKSTASS